MARGGFAATAPNAAGPSSDRKKGLVEVDATAVLCDTAKGAAVVVDANPDGAGATTAAAAEDHGAAGANPVVAEEEDGAARKTGSAVVVAVVVVPGVL